MIPIDPLIELLGIVTAPWGARGPLDAVRPTPRSVEKIQRELGITIPADYVRIASACSTYIGWLASIGEDYDDHGHILRVNAVFHDSEEPPVLPPHFVLLNHGHDGDCDCWDLRAPAIGGEHPIVYVDLESDHPEAGGIRFESFRAYIEHFVRHQAPSVRDPSRRRRAQSLLEEY